MRSRAARRSFANELAALKPLADDGLLTIAGARIMVTERGRAYVRIAAAAFDAYMQDGPETAFGGGVSGIRRQKKNPGSHFHHLPGDKS